MVNGSQILRLAAAGLVAAVAGIDGVSQPTCRNVATSATHVTTAGGFTATIKLTCTITRTPLTGTCTNSYSDNLTRAGTTTSSTTNYASIADFVDEVRVVPPLFKGLSGSATATGQAGTNATTTAYSYDPQGRLTGQVSKGPSGTVTITYTQWDSAGRPTRARDVSRGSATTRVISYDDAARTRTTRATPEGQTIAVVTVETFDADGNPTRQTAAGAAGSGSNTIITTHATERICR